MVVLITGGAGYIGSALTKQFLKTGHRVVVVDDLCSSQLKNLPSKADFYQLDVRCTQNLSQCIALTTPDLVIHLAALSSPFASVSAASEFISVNVDGTESVLEACEKNGVHRLLFASSASVYGEQPSDSELNQCKPISPYGESKLQAEKLILKKTDTSSLHSLILRLFNVAGASKAHKSGQLRKFPYHLVDLCAQAALDLRNELYIYGQDYANPDGTTIRDFIHLEDTVQYFYRAALSILDDQHTDTFNCGSGTESSVLDVIKTMESVAGRRLKVIEKPRRLGDPARLVAQTKKISTYFNYNCQVSDLHTICKSAYDWEASQINKKLILRSATDLV